MEAIILVGGFGTRLKHIVTDVPKPMADINGHPFLQYLFEYLRKYGVNNVVLAVGYKYQYIKEFFNSKYKDINIRYSIEESPLGTGGAIKKAIELCSSDNILILNGDTYFNVNLFDMNKFHINNNSKFTVAVKEMDNFERYGTVKINNNKICEFVEKKPAVKGIINGGVYIINRNIIDMKNKIVFSFEKDILEKLTIETFAFKSDDYFIDIGVPEDYYRAQIELVKFK